MFKFDIKNLNHGYKKILGLSAIIIGFIALITPFTPGAFWLLFIGLQMLGVHLVFLDKVERQLKKLGGKFKNKV